MRERLGARFSAFPAPLQALVAALAAVGATAAIFFAVVYPLVHNTGPRAAELAGSIPSSAVVNQTLTMDVSVDNTGDRLINPVCLAASFDRPVDVTSVTFQGLDTVTARNGRACGGQLSTQETISIKIRVVPRQAGSVHAQVVVAQQDTTIGRPLQGTISVGAR